MGVFISNIKFNLNKKKISFKPYNNKVLYGFFCGKTLAMRSKNTIPV